MNAALPHRAKFTIAQFHRMAETGILRSTDRIELIEGDLIDMAPIGSLHAYVVDELAKFLIKAVGADVRVSVQNPLLLAEDSQPQPDLMLLRHRDYRRSLPSASDVLLLIEVADTSLEYDTLVKVPLYAKHGISEVWVVNLMAKALQIYAEPVDAQWQKQLTVAGTELWSSITLPTVSVDLRSVFA